MIIIIFFSLNLDYFVYCVTPGNCWLAVYLVVKSFLLVSSRAMKFLCGQIENVKTKKAISAATVVCQLSLEWDSKINQKGHKQNL